MTDRNIIPELAAKLGINQRTVKAVLDEFAMLTARCLQSGDEVKLYKFVKFYSKYCPERQRFNPRTGETMTEKEHYIPRTEFSDSFKRAINDNEFEV